MMAFAFSAALMVSILQPRLDVPWLGDLAHLRTASQDTKDAEVYSHSARRLGPQLLYFSFVKCPPRKFERRAKCSIAKLNSFSLAVCSTSNRADSEIS